MRTTVTRATPTNAAISPPGTASVHHGTRPNPANAPSTDGRDTAAPPARPGAGRTRGRPSRSSSRSAARRFSGVETTTAPTSATSSGTPRRTMVTDAVNGSAGSTSSTQPVVVAAQEEGHEVDEPRQRDGHENQSRLNPRLHPRCTASIGSPEATRPATPDRRPGLTPRGVRSAPRARPRRRGPRTSSGRASPRRRAGSAAARPRSAAPASATTRRLLSFSGRIATSSRCSLSPNEHVVAGHRERGRREPAPGPAAIDPVAGAGPARRAVRDPRDGHLPGEDRLVARGRAGSRSRTAASSPRGPAG